MKKLFLTLIAVLAISIGTVNAQAVWGARVGLSKPTVSGNGGSIDGKFGVEAGPVLYYSLKGNFYINPSLMFSIKTFDFAEESLSMYYVDVPVYAGYNIPAGKVSFYAQAGPFVGFKLGESISSDMADESGLGAINAGLGAIFGVSVNRFKIEFGYQHGLMNILKEKIEGAKINLSSIFIGINYVF
ncbi:MAG: PorT family protein [Prevotellaceae bacterium]|jgi:hypothetical protein|nr:PorT family protein [Prevotellaceae bacterium]